MIKKIILSRQPNMNKSTAATEMFREIHAIESVCDWISKADHRETKQLFAWYLVTAVVNIFLSIATSCGNILILFSLTKEYTLSASSRILFRSLAASDLCVGLVSQPLFVISILLISNGHWQVCGLMRYTTYVVSTTLCGISLLTVTTISMDRLLVLLLKSKYSLTVTSTRVKVVVVFFWIFSLAVSTTYLISRPIFFTLSCVVIMLSIFISAYSYFSIFILLRRRQRLKIQDNCRGQINSFQLQRERRYQSTVYSALWFHFVLAICYIPFSVLEALAVVVGTRLPVFIAGSFTGTLIYLNSMINPLLYCWKIKEVRQAVKQIVSCS